MDNSNADRLPRPPLAEAEEGVSNKFRRNGKLQSCEPCRLRKQSCSHQTPCSRCIKHNRNCVYVDAPMSKERNAAAGGSALPPTPSASDVSSPKTIVRKAGPPLRKSSTQDNPLTLETGGSIGYRRTHTGLSLGYVGSTGYSAILDEAKAHIGMNIWELQDGLAENEWAARPDGSRPGRAFCKRVLGWLPSREVAEKVRRWMGEQWTFSLYDFPSFENWHAAFWDAYGDTLDGARGDDALNAMIDELVANTRRSLSTAPRTNAEWLASYCGRKSRWEVVGEIFLCMGNMAALAPYSDPLMIEILPPEFRNKKKSYACSMLECADACLLLCDELDISSNHLIAGLLSRCVTLQSVIMGDSSYDLWKRVGQVANAITGLGLHRKLENAEQIAPLYVEQRSRTFASAYSLTLCIAVFLGRPPTISRRYVSIPLPLDVPEEAILEANKVSDTFPLIGRDGWALDRKVTGMTLGRLYMITSLYKDEILEISLGQPQYSDVGERVRDLHYRLRDLRNQLPPIFNIPLDKAAFTERSILELSLVASTRLNFLHLEFLIDRIEYEGRDERRFLLVAQDMLKIVTVHWTERDRFPTHRDEVHWFISYAGIPAASALAMDLFKQTTSMYAQPYSAQRAEIIQDLSLFVACLDWVRPEDGNYVLCGRVRKLIRHILDRVLSPSVQQIPEQDFSGYNLNDLNIDNLPQYGVDFTDWLGGIDAEGLESDWTTSLLQCPGRFS